VAYVVVIVLIVIIIIISIKFTSVNNIPRSNERFFCILCCCLIFHSAQTNSGASWVVQNYIRRLILLLSKAETFRK